MRFNTTNFRTNTKLLCHAGKRRNNGYFMVFAFLDRDELLGYSKFELCWRHVQLSKVDRFRRTVKNYDI